MLTRYGDLEVRLTPNASLALRKRRSALPGGIFGIPLVSDRKHTVTNGRIPKDIPGGLLGVITEAADKANAERSFGTSGKYLKVTEDHVRAALKRNDDRFRRFLKNNSQ